MSKRGNPYKLIQLVQWLRALIFLKVAWSGISLIGIHNNTKGTYLKGFTADSRLRTVCTGGLSLGSSSQQDLIRSFMAWVPVDMDRSGRKGSPLPWYTHTFSITSEKCNEIVVSIAEKDVL